MSRMSIVERRPFIDNVNKCILEYFAQDGKKVAKSLHDSGKICTFAS